MLSVVIPTCDRRASVLRVVEAVLGQRSGDLDVVVVVDGGNALDELSALDGGPVRIIEQPRAGAGAARNRGVQEARGDRIVFLDDDVVPEPGFLVAVERALEEGADVALGSLRCGNDVPDTLLRREFEYWLRPEAQPLPGAPITFDEVLFCATAVRRSSLEQVGGFDESFTAAGGYGNEDVELGLRLMTAGATIVRVPAQARTGPNLDPRSVLHRSRLAGHSDVLLARRHPQARVALFDEKLRSSRLDRVLAPPLTRFPALGGALAPLCIASCAAIDRRLLRTPGRLWNLLRKAAYWRGVGEAGGGPLRGGP